MDCENNRIRPSFTVSFGNRVLLFVCITAICFLIGALLVALVASKATPPAVRVATILQDIMLFILPAVAFSCIITRMPARFLMIDRPPRLLPMAIALAALFASVPAMNALVAWNENLHLPESMAAVEQAMRDSENAAKGMIDTLIGDRSSVGSLIMALLIVGVMAGLSEEIYFRGGMQRLLATGPVNPNAAIWLTAFIFSAIHFQFFGFFPRLLLGAYFGYLAWWSKSLWIPIIVHMVNNMTVVVGEFYGSDFGIGFDTVGTENSASATVWIVISAILTSALLYLFYRLNNCKK